MLDLLITHALYPDFEAGEMKRGSIGIRDGRIAYVGDGAPEAAEVLDAGGHVVSPGFIDIHMHEEKFDEEGERYRIAEMMLEMGVTTAVGGNCGLLNTPFDRFREVIEKLGGAPVHYMMFTGYNTYRRAQGLGHYDPASEEQMLAIRECLKKDLAAGACGISFGIEYDPAITTGEVLFALEADGDPEHLAAAHYRDDSIRAIPSIREMIEIQSRIPMKFQISHLSSCSAMGQMEEALEIINEAIDKDPRLNYDTYPYNAFSTHIGSTVFEDDCLSKWGKEYSDIMLTLPPYEGVRCTEEIFRDAREHYPEMLAVAFAMNEEEIAAAIANRHGMVASDAILNDGSGHPRAHGTFPRVLGKYVREDKVLPLAAALRKMTLEPAKRLGLTHKGVIAEGADADLTIFDPETIADRADFTDVTPRPDGIDWVLIGGRKALDHGRIVNGRLGRFIAFADRNKRD